MGVAGEPKWSPYGCHYYPDLAEFPDPKVETLPDEPLQSGEQYFLDLAGNIKKGPLGHGSTCYCAPFIHRYYPIIINPFEAIIALSLLLLSRFEQKMDKNKRDLVKHLESTHGQLATRINHLERKTRDQISNMSNSIKETLAQERLECQDRMERRAIRDRIAIDRNQAMKHTFLSQDLTQWMESRMKSLEDSASKNHHEHVALLRSLLRGSKRRKRALRSELTSGAFRRALSEDENEENDVGDLDDDFINDDLNDHNMAQSEYNFASTTVVHNTEMLQERLRGLHVSDHPRLLPGGQPGNQSPKPVPSVRVRRNSAGDETMLFCDFGDFNTQELISSPVDFNPGPSPSLKLDPFLAYSTHSESTSSHTLRPIPYSPVSCSSTSNVLYQNMTFTKAQMIPPPQIPPKSQIPPPYRPAPPPQFLRKAPHLTFDHDHQTILGAMSSSDGGSHDSHNDSGYCVRGSGGPSPSLSGKIFKSYQ